MSHIMIYIMIYYHYYYDDYDDDDDYYYNSHCTGFVWSAQPGSRTDMWPRARRMALVSSLTSARRRNLGRLERGLELIELEVLMGKP